MCVCDWCVASPTPGKKSRRAEILYVATVSTVPLKFVTININTDAFPDFLLGVLHYRLMHYSLIRQLCFL